MAITGDPSLLPELDIEYLTEKGLDCEVVKSNGETRIKFPNYRMPAHYQPEQTTLLLRLPAGYPNANPDMFWTSPDVRLRNGTYPINSEYHDPTADNWQRWSRHDYGWRPGVDDLRTKLAAVRRELEKGR